MKSKILHYIKVGGNSGGYVWANQLVGYLDETPLGYAVQ